MFRNTAKLLTLAAGLTLSGQAFAQATDAETTDASITLVEPIVITETATLRFGQVAKGDALNNNIVINEDTGARTITGTGNAGLAGGTSGRATFDVDGETDATFDIGITDATIDLTDGGTGSLAATLVASDTTGTLTGGTATFGVGGTLVVDNTDATDLAGDYTGTFEVTATYN